MPLEGREHSEELGKKAQSQLGHLMLAGPGFHGRATCVILATDLGPEESG